MVTYEELRDELAEILFEAHYGEDTKRLMYPHVTYKRLATAAIATILENMSEPTPEMIEAGVTAEYGKTLGMRATNCWRFMLAASPLVEDDRR